MKCHHCKEARRDIPLNRITLCFPDRDTEASFREYRSEVASRQLRRFIILVLAVSLLMTQLISHQVANAKEAGLALPPQMTQVTPAGGAIGLILIGVLFWATVLPRLRSHLHTITLICIAGLTVVDHVLHMVHVPLTWALTGTLLNLVIIYVASQLRFIAASMLGIASTLLHACIAMNVHGVGPGMSAQLQLEFGMNMGVLLAANILLMFLTHQRELSQRHSFYRARLLEQRGSELEAALSDLKAAEMQLIDSEKQAVVGRLVAGILHEVNSPLGALSSATHTLRRGLEKVERATNNGSAEANPELQRTLSANSKLATVQEQSSERIRQVLDELKQFVSLDQNERTTVDIRRGLETAAHLVRPSLAAGVELKLQLPDEPVLVHCFPARLNQVFFNLMQNAVASFEGKGPSSEGGSDSPNDDASGITFRGKEEGADSAPPENAPADVSQPRPFPGTPTGRILVSVQSEGDSVQVIVKDSGRGIPADALNTVFDFNFSTEGRRVKLRLGLPASRRAVEEIDGTLSLESEIGRGTRAIVTLPGIPAREAAQTA